MDRTKTKQKSKKKKKKFSLKGKGFAQRKGLQSISGSSWRNAPMNRKIETKGQCRTHADSCNVELISWYTVTFWPSPMAMSSGWWVENLPVERVDPGADMLEGSQRMAQLASDSRGISPWGRWRTSRVVCLVCHHDQDEKRRWRVSQSIPNHWYEMTPFFTQIFQCLHFKHTGLKFHFHSILKRGGGRIRLTLDKWGSFKRFPAAKWEKV